MVRYRAGRGWTGPLQYRDDPAQKHNRAGAGGRPAGRLAIRWRDADPQAMAVVAGRLNDRVVRGERIAP